MKPGDSNIIKLVEWDDDDGCYVGSAPGFLGPCCHGGDEAKVYKELCVIVNEWVKTHLAEGIPLPESFAKKDFSGKFVLRVGKPLHKAIAIRALKNGVSINKFCTNLLSELVVKSQQK